MEGDRVQSRTWSLLLQLLPTPFRWVGLEVGRLIHWIDHGAGRLIVGLRTSPAWYFVTSVGMIGIGLTILLFISVLEQTSNHHSKASAKTTSRAVVHLGRAHLEKTHEWSAQDRWRVAHLFVPHKPADRPKDIVIDSRLMAADTNSQRGAGRVTSSSDASMYRSGKELEVRMDISRPKTAQQGKRLVAESILDSGSRIGSQSDTQLKLRNPRLLVQAAWQFGPECSQNEYVARPTRRIIPVPVPEPELPLPLPFVPRHHDAPDLAFAMELIRHFSTASLFPHGSHLVHVSDRSVFPIEDPRYQNELVSFGDPGWQVFGHARRHGDESYSMHDIQPYGGVGEYDRMASTLQTSDEYDANLRSFTDIGLRVELSVPHNVAGGRPNESRLLVRNEGDDTIPQVEIQDLISQLHTVVAAEPDGAVESTTDSHTGSHEKLLHREIEGLAPGDTQEFALRWIPEGGRRHTHRTRVIAQAAVSTVTEVVAPEPDQQMQSIPPEIPPEKHPSVACDFNYLERVYVGDEFDLEVTVRNTGDTTLHNVQVRLELPSELSHRDGNHVVIDAGNLLVNGRNQKVLRVSARQAGDAINKLQVASAEHVEAHGHANILVVDRSKEPAALVPVPETINPKPQTISSPNVQPSGNCCCQKSPIIPFKPVRQLP